MPAGNGTGPMGMGPMTGRAAGYCAGYPLPGFANPMLGRGRGFYPYRYMYPGMGYYGASYPAVVPRFGRRFWRGRGRW
jgi:hypothetical protein